MVAKIPPVPLKGELRSRFFILFGDPLKSKGPRRGDFRVYGFTALTLFEKQFLCVLVGVYGEGF
jgi:hypothetical protein